MSIRSVVIYCGTNNIDTSNSDEISVGVVTIARSTYRRYPNIEVIVSGLLPSTQRVKINKTNDYCKRSKKTTLMRQDPDWTLPDNSLSMELYYKDHVHLIENRNIKFSNWLLKHCRTYYHQNHHNHHHTCHNHHWSDHHFHLPYPGQTFFPFKHFPNHLHFNHRQPQQHPSNRNVELFCLILWLLHQNHKH